MKVHLTKSQFLEQGFTTVVCEFTPGGRSYTYLTNLDLAIGDRVLVAVKDTLKIITVVGLNSPTPKADVIEYKWIIGKVTGNYNVVKDIILVEG